MHFHDFVVRSGDFDFPDGFPVLFLEFGLDDLPRHLVGCRLNGFLNAHFCIL